MIEIEQFPVSKLPKEFQGDFEDQATVTVVVKRSDGSLPEMTNEKFEQKIIELQKTVKLKDSIEKAFPYVSGFIIGAVFATFLYTTVFSPHAPQYNSFSSLLLDVDDGVVSADGAPDGFFRYSNNTLNMTLLVPDTWAGDVGINGAYSIRPKNSPEQVGLSVYKKDVAVFENNSDTVTSIKTLADLEQAQRQFYTDENIGPNLEVSVSQTELDGLPAFELTAIYGSSQQHFSKNSMTLDGNMVYWIGFGGDTNVQAQYLGDYEQMKDSFKILR